MSSAESVEGAGDSAKDDVKSLATVWPTIATFVESPVAMLRLEPNDAVESPPCSINVLLRISNYVRLITCEFTGLCELSSTITSLLLLRWLLILWSPEWIDIKFGM